MIYVPCSTNLCVIYLYLKTQYNYRDDHYWSGYFTSRPFYKNLDRILEHYLRSAEIMYSMMWAEMEYVGSDFPEMAAALMENLVFGRQNLALFQHHDGVTGTAKGTALVYQNYWIESLFFYQKLVITWGIELMVILEVSLFTKTYILFIRMYIFDLTLPYIFFFLKYNKKNPNPS